MSATEEREIEIVAGTIGGITQKKADTWTVAVTVDGLQNAKNLWTKDAELIESLQAKFGQAGAFVCSASYWQHPQHGQVRSLWIQNVGEAGVSAPPDGDPGAAVAPRVPSPANPASSVATPAAAPITGASKDRLIVRQTCIKAAAEWGASIPEVRTPEDVMAVAAKWERWVTLGLLEPIPFD